jgi:hypothetical protein
MAMGDPFCSAIESGPVPTYTFHPAAVFGGAPPRLAGWTSSELEVVVTVAGMALAPSSPPAFTQATVT